MEGEYPYRNHWINEDAAELLSSAGRAFVDRPSVPGGEPVDMAVAELIIEGMEDVRDRYRREDMEQIFYYMSQLPEMYLRILDESLEQENIPADRREFVDAVILTLTGYSILEPDDTATDPLVLEPADTASDPVDLNTPEILEMLEELFGDESEKDDKRPA